MKPILFNTEMVRAILEGRKTVTRRVVARGKSNPLYHCRDKYYGIVDHLNNDYKNWYAGFYNDSDIFYGANGSRHIDAIYFKAPYKVGDVLYVRETWNEVTNGYIYKATNEPVMVNGYKIDFRWRPSIHMPKAAARIFLRVTSVRVERLHDMTVEDCHKEGVNIATSSITDGETLKRNHDFSLEKFETLWDSTIKHDQLKYYGWESNPYVWVIEFERVEGKCSD